MAKSEYTVWNVMKQAWVIKKYEIKDLDINPDKDWNQITLQELGWLACHLDVTTWELIQNT